MSSLKEKKHAFDKAIRSMIELAVIMGAYEKTSKEIKEVIGDLVVSKWVLIENMEDKE